MNKQIFSQTFGPFIRYSDGNSDFIIAGYYQEASFVPVYDINVQSGYKFLFASAIEEGASDYLGTELDLVFELNLDENVTIGAGYSQMFAGGSMEILKGGSASETANWAWLMVTVTPTFFTSSQAGSR